MMNMLKKKGFTLIELLSVIVILAIIALIAVPTIVNIITKVRISTAKANFHGYIDAVEYQIARDEIRNKLSVSWLKNG